MCVNFLFLSFTLSFVHTHTVFYLLIFYTTILGDFTCSVVSWLSCYFLISSIAVLPFETDTCIFLPEISWAYLLQWRCVNIHFVKQPHPSLSFLSSPGPDSCKIWPNTTGMESGRWGQNQNPTWLTWLSSIPSLCLVGNSQRSTWQLKLSRWDG